MDADFWVAFGSILVGALVFLVAFDIWDERRARRRHREQLGRRP